MSIQLINQYYSDVDHLIQFGGKANEAVVSQKFGESRISGTAHNVFGIQTGVAVMFLVRKRGGAKQLFAYLL